MASPGRNRHRANAPRIHSTSGDRHVSETSPAKVVAGSLGLAAFAIALLARYFLNPTPMVKHLNCARSPGRLSKRLPIMNGKMAIG